MDGWMSIWLYESTLIFPVLENRLSFHLVFYLGELVDLLLNSMIESSKEVKGNRLEMSLLLATKL